MVLCTAVIYIFNFPKQNFLLRQIRSLRMSVLFDAEFSLLRLNFMFCFIQLFSNPEFSLQFSCKLFCPHFCLFVQQFFLSLRLSVQLLFLFLCLSVQLLFLSLRLFVQLLPQHGKFFYTAFFYQCVQPFCHFMNDLLLYTRQLFLYRPLHQFFYGRNYSLLQFFFQDIGNKPEILMV